MTTAGRIGFTWIGVWAILFTIHLVLAARYWDRPLPKIFSRYLAPFPAHSAGDLLGIGFAGFVWPAVLVIVLWIKLWRGVVYVAQADLRRPKSEPPRLPDDPYLIAARREVERLVPEDRS